MLRSLLIILLALLTAGFISVNSSLEVSNNSQIKDQSEYSTIKTDRRKLRRKSRKRCQRRNPNGTDSQIKKCTRRRMKKIDADKDGIHRKRDNCLDTINNDQSDFDADSVGDACDMDNTQSL